MEIQEDLTVRSSHSYWPPKLLVTQLLTPGPRQPGGAKYGYLTRQRSDGHCHSRVVWKPESGYKIASQPHYAADLVEEAKFIQLAGRHPNIVQLLFLEQGPVTKLYL